MTVQAQGKDDEKFVDNDYFSIRFDGDSKSYMPLIDFLAAPGATVGGYSSRISSIELSSEGSIESLTMEIPSQVRKQKPKTVEVRISGLKNPHFVDEHNSMAKIRVQVLSKGAYSK